MAHVRYEANVDRRARWDPIAKTSLSRHDSQKTGGGAPWGRVWPGQEAVLGSYFPDGIIPGSRTQVSRSIQASRRLKQPSIKG